MAEPERQRRFEVSIEQELKTSYLNYAMSVLVARALPDARDGLKPSQRRILVACRDLDLGPRSKHRKCAKIAGDTSGNYHPHGEQVVYPTLVRMAQPFNMRYPLIDGQGNFGSVDGDPPAAMRYTEARLSQAAMEMLDDLERDTVEMRPNYDETRTEPVVLPARFPNLLANGASGIAVGMATSIPPHNIVELCRAIRLVLRRPECTVMDILRQMPGPDFPTGGIVLGASGLLRGYATGSGRIVVRARTHFEPRGPEAHSIVITEIPYAVSKAAIIEKIAECARSGRIDAIADIRDETDRHGMRIVVMLKRGEDPEVVLNNLFQHTPLQTTFSLNFIALSAGRPVQMNIKELILAYIDHRREVIRRRTRFLLERARARLHVVEGLLVALAALDEVIALIRGAEDVAAARQALCRRFGLSEKQADAILAMRLSQLTRLEAGKLREEAAALKAEIADYEDILARPGRIDDLIAADLEREEKLFGDERRTEIRQEEVRAVDIEDLVQEEAVSVTVSQAGYVKRQPLDAYRAQRRGGVGVIGAPTREGDYVRDVFVANTHDHLLVFTSAGRVHSVRVFEIPEMGRYSRGRALSNFLGLGAGEEVHTVLPVASFEGESYVFFATRRGRVKKTPLTAFAHVRRGGIRALILEEGDALVGVVLTTGEDQIFMASRRGYACLFRESDVRPMGRASAGVRGMLLREGDAVVSMFRGRPGCQVLTVCRNGYGKRTPLADYRLTRRGARGVRNIIVNRRNGEVVESIAVDEADDILIVTAGGQVVRTAAAGISRQGRNTQGVRLVRLREGDYVAAVSRIPASEA